MVVSPRVTLLVFFTLAKLAVTARAWSSLHSSFIVKLECGCFFLFCAETFAVCVHLRKEPSPSPLVQYSHQICAIPFAFDARCLLQATHIRGWKKWVHNKKLKKQNKASGKRERAWERRRCKHRGKKQRPAIHHAIEPVAPSLVVSLVAHVCSRCGTALAEHPGLWTRLLPALPVLLVSSPLLSTAL